MNFSHILTDEAMESIFEKFAGGVKWSDSDHHAATQLSRTIEAAILAKLAGSFVLPEPTYFTTTAYDGSVNHTPYYTEAQQITAQARAALEQPLEPVAYELFAIKYANGKKLVYEKPDKLPSYIGCRPLYAAPQPVQNEK